MAARSNTGFLLRLWVRIPPEVWMFVCCECFVLSGRGFCDELITRPEESYRMCCVGACDLETLWTTRGLLRHKNVCMSNESHWLCFKIDLLYILSILPSAGRMYGSLTFPQTSWGAIKTTLFAKLWLHMFKVPKPY